MLAKNLLPKEIKHRRFGSGPWVEEYDRYDFFEGGLLCLALRMFDYGHWCGYVAVPPGHPLHGKDTEYNHGEDLPADANTAHGGITYGSDDNGLELDHRVRAKISGQLREIGLDVKDRSLEDFLVCIRPRPKGHEDDWWLGFDFCHPPGDYSPLHGFIMSRPKGKAAYCHAAALEGREAEQRRDPVLAEMYQMTPLYADAETVVRECRAFARDLMRC